MVQLRRTINDDQHLYIKVGPSKGTKQIKDDGIVWLRKQKYSFPPPGGGVQLDLGDYRYLEGEGHLYIKGEEHTLTNTQLLQLPLLPPEAVEYGPPLLLLLADCHHTTNNNADWTLVLKLDQWEESTRNALLQNRAAAVGCYVSSELFSSVSLQKIHYADNWPEVAPQKENYVLYWQSRELFQKSSQSAICLKEATPTIGLKTGWQGNVFLKFTGSGLQNAWKRYLPGMSILANDLHEFYWLAQEDQKPEPLWPGKVQRVGQPNRGWQLWHLQIVQETDKEEVEENVAEWLWYRQINLRYRAWRLQLLNPLSSVSEQGYTYICTPSQQLLVRCDPPTQQTENGSTSAFLSLTRYSKSTTSQHQSLGSSVLSQRLISDQENYLLLPAPPANQEYRIAVSINGKQACQSLRVQTAPLSIRQPILLYGLRCTLTIAGKQHPIKAFSDNTQPDSDQLSVDKDFSLEQLAQATWSYQPSGIPCSLRWEYLSPQGKSCQDKSKPIKTDHALTGQWRYIWEKVTESKSPWVKLTLDAASFGSITLCLILKKQELQSISNHQVVSGQNLENSVASPETQKLERSLTNTDQQVWWMNPRYSATLFWLSRMAEQGGAQVHMKISPEFSLALEQLCAPDMPAGLKNALQHLAASQNLPVWIYFCLRKLLADVHSTFE